MYQPISLPYSSNALAPFLSQKTVDTHYQKHYLSYLKKLNQLLSKNRFDFRYPKDQLFQNIDLFPLLDRGEILYNAGGVVNHELYFENMTPKDRMEIAEPLKTALIQKFGGVDTFFQIFMTIALSLTGSGYTFLAMDEKGELILFNLANQETPYLYNMTPLLAFDLWEHAYYLDYQNEKERYIRGFLDHVDFDEVNRRYQTALSKIKK